MSVERLRVVYFAEVFPSESETWVHHEIKELLSHGIDVTIVATRERPISYPADLQILVDRTTYLPECARDVVRLPILCSFLRHIPGIAWQWICDGGGVRGRAQVLRDLGYMVRILPLLTNMRPQLFMAHFGGTRCNLALMASRAMRVPFVFKMHAYDVFNRVPMLRTKLAEAARVLTISQYNISYISKHYPDVRHDRLEKHFCGVPIDQYQFAPQRHVSSTGPQIIAVGRLVRMKGFDILVNASRILRDQQYDHQITIVGSGPQEGELRQQVATHGLHRHVSLVGYATPADVKERLRTADIFVLPAVWDPIAHSQDGIPLAIMEAMAMGVPVISTRLSGIPELVDDHITGFLVSPGSPSDLATAIRKVAGLSVAERDTILASARRRIETRHDIRRLTADLADMFVRYGSPGGHAGH